MLFKLSATKRRAYQKNMNDFFLQFYITNLVYIFFILTSSQSILSPELLYRDNVMALILGGMQKTNLTFVQDGPLLTTFFIILNSLEL